MPLPPARPRPRRSALGVVHEFAEFLRAAAGSGDLRGPADGGLARREFQDAEAAVELLGLRVGLVRDGAVGGDHQRRDALVDTAAEHVDAGFLRLADDRVGRFPDGGHVPGGDVHRRSGERDQVLRHRSIRWCEFRYWAWGRTKKLSSRGRWEDCMPRNPVMRPRSAAAAGSARASPVATYLPQLDLLATLRALARPTAQP